MFEDEWKKMKKSRKINQFYWKYIAQEKNFQFNLISNVYVLKTFDKKKLWL